MSRDFVPPRPSGFDREAIFDQSTHDKTHGPSARFNDSSTVKIKRTTKGYSWHAQPAKGGTASTPAPPTKEYKVVASFAQYLTVQDANGIKYAVAKPPELRCSATSATIEGKSIAYDYPGIGTLLFMRRKSTFSGVIAYEGITPPYIHGASYVYADAPTFMVQVVTVAGDTNSYGSPPVLNVAGTAITLMDTNRSGRAWSVLADQTPPGA